MSPIRDGLDPYPPLYEPAPDQDAICTSDEHCQALADAHEPDCPVERRLEDELGY